jgi:hypothetical protein
LTRESQVPEQHGSPEVQVAPSLAAELARDASDHRLVASELLAALF